MALFLTFLVLWVALTAVFWGGSMFLQGWLYQNPAEKMPLRAVASGLVIALFLSLWCWLDVKNPGKYETLIEFSSTEIKDYNEFVSVSRRTDGKEESVAYKKRVGSPGRSEDFYHNAKPWTKNSSQSMVVAILIKEPGKEEMTRFNANLVKTKVNGKETEEFPNELVYREDRGSRFMLGETLGRVHRKKTGVLLGNLLLNGLHFVFWWLVLWYGLRFLLWHAFGIAIVLWLFTMLGLQPVLFGLNRPTEVQVAEVLIAPKVV